jgi:hypothetical protein
MGFFLNLVVVAQSGSGSLRMNFQHKILCSKVENSNLFLSSTADFCILIVKLGGTQFLALIQGRSWQSCSSKEDDDGSCGLGPCICHRSFLI